MEIAAFGSAEKIEFLRVVEGKELCDAAVCQIQIFSQCLVYVTGQDLCFKP